VALLLSLGAALAGCTTAPSRPPRDRTADPVAAAPPQPILHHLLGQDAATQPLLPQPGDIWADVLPPPVAAPAGVPRPAAAPAAPTRAGMTATIATTATQAASPTPGIPDSQRATLPPPGTASDRTPPGVAVQLAASPSPELADRAWERLRHDSPVLLRGHTSFVVAAEVDGRPVWRLRTAGFADLPAAAAFCRQVRAAAAACWVVPDGAAH
jgi:hypothetical protein